MHVLTPQVVVVQMCCGTRACRGCVQFEAAHALLHLDDHTALAPLVQCLMSIPAELTACVQALATGNLDQAPPEFRDVLVPLHVRFLLPGTHLHIPQQYAAPVQRTCFVSTGIPPPTRTQPSRHCTCTGWSAQLQLCSAPPLKHCCQ